MSSQNIYDRQIIDEKFTLLLEDSSEIDWTMISHEHEAATDDLLQSLFERSKDFISGWGGRSVFLDIGAHWGLYALYFARKKICGEIYTFESDAYNFSQLQAQLFLNNFSFDVRSFYGPVSDRVSTFQLLRSTEHESGNRAGAGIIGEGAEFKNWNSVPSMRVDDCLPDLSGGKVMIKIDVEGHEHGVLRGVQRILNENDCLIQCETVDAFAKETDEIMKQCGYTRYDRIRIDSFYCRSGT